MYEEYKKMKIPRVTIEVVTPEMAEGWLERSEFHNRKVKRKTIERYAAEIRNGDWNIYSFEPICFDDEENILNGQHRLTAIMRSGISVPMWLARGVDKRGTFYDRGSLRSPKDALHMEGIEVTAYELSVAGWIISFVFHYDNFSDHQKAKYILNHQDQLDIAISCASKKSGGGKNLKSLTRKAACMASAYQALRGGVSEETLTDFFYVVNTGFMKEPWETAAIVARNYMLEHRNMNQTSDDVEIDKVLQNAIYDYNRKYPRKITYKNTQYAPYKAEFINQDKAEIDLILGKTTS